jgi:regulator of nucleoside diphosphate kinase
MREIYVTRRDLRRLNELVGVARAHERESERYLIALEEELSRAKVVAPEDIPPEVITMNSKVLLRDCETGSETVYTLVFPADSDPARCRVSVLAPIGTAMLGYRVGDTFEWQAPRGVRRLEVKEVVYQPEAAGHYAL